MATVRVTGNVGFIASREVTSSKNGQQYTFHTATVVVAGRGVADVSFSPERLNGLTFGEGDSVDWLCNADTYGNRLTLDLLSEYPRQLAEKEAGAFLDTFTGEPAESLA